MMSYNSANEPRFERWLEVHRGIIFKVTRSFARTPTESADLQQEIRLQIWNSLSAYSGRAKESTWVYRVCLNTAIAWRRTVARREARIEPGMDLSHMTTSAASPADSAGQRELLEKLYAAIQGIGDFDRALVLLMLDGLPYREIAEVTGLSETHVGVALSRARKRLAKRMKGITDELE